jgi:hypothetical protein
MAGLARLEAAGVVQVDPAGGSTREKAREQRTAAGRRRQEVEDDGVGLLGL